MNINRTANSISFRTTRSKSSYAQLTDSVKQSSFGEVLKQTSAKDTFSSAAPAERTTTKDIVSSAPDTQERLDKISEAIKNTDYSEMSKAEIYADIEKKYEDAFDNFHMTMAVCVCKEDILVHDQFLNDIHNNIGYNITPLSLVKEARGYSDMSYDEIESLIKEKYTGKTGYIDQLNLFGELYSSGVLFNKFGWDTATKMTSQLNLSIECGGEKMISKNEWLSRTEQTGASSPFSLLLNNPYFARDKEMFRSIVDDILFGIADKA